MKKRGRSLGLKGDYVTTAEAAKATGLTVQTIKAHIRAHQKDPKVGIKATMPMGKDPRSPGHGIQYIILISDLEEWFFGRTE